MIKYKTSGEIESIRHSCLLVGDTIAELAKIIRPGITTMQLDITAEQYIRDNGVIPSFKNYRGFPFASCISVNDAVVHGFPTNGVLKEDDIISVDIGVFKNGYHGDSAYTFGLSGITNEAKQLMTVTKA